MRLGRRTGQGVATRSNGLRGAMDRTTAASGEALPPSSITIESQQDLYRFALSTTVSPLLSVVSHER
jgi:hypothetical protein